MIPFKKPPKPFIKISLRIILVWYPYNFPSPLAMAREIAFIDGEGGDDPWKKGESPSPRCATSPS